MPTQKAKGTAKTIGEKVGIPIGMAMRENGYAISTSESPKKLTDTNGWKELMNQQLPDKDLAEVHREGLRADKKVFKNNNETGEIELVSEEPDHLVRHKYLETAYKIKGKLKESVELLDERSTYIENQNVIIIVKEAEEKIRKQLEN